MTPVLWFRQSGQPGAGDLTALQERFAAFLLLLERNHQVLATIADMEEKARGEHLFDANYVRASVATIREGVQAIIEQMVLLGGEPYALLRERYRAIDRDLDALLLGRRPIPQDAYTIPFDTLGHGRAFSVGSKNAQLGELKSRLRLPVPDGFAISAWAYKRFVDANDLQARITQRISSLDIKKYADLLAASAAIRAMIEASPVPSDVADAIWDSCNDLRARAAPVAVSLRSSAIGEDAVYSFAGQYDSFLNVPFGDVLDRYRSVLAGKFTPQAIYYFLSHALLESDLAMSVSCVAMVDAAASGVVYTRDPVNPDEDTILVSAIYGLGKYLVDGTVTPDVFRVSRTDGAVLSAQVARKPIRLVLSQTGGTREDAVPDEEQAVACVSEPHLQRLAKYAAAIETHCGCPQDIEWAVDREGRLFLLQSRRLRVVAPRRTAHPPDLAGRDALRRGGVTASPGAGGGPVYHAASTHDLSGIPDGVVLVAPNAFAGLAAIVHRISALVTETGGVASHIATIARERQLPTLTGVERAMALRAGDVVTVDATGAAIYAGLIPELIEARRPEEELFEDSPVFTLLDRVLSRISPLSLLHPSDPAFTPENCRTLHDITRFAHQRAMEEIFTKAKALGHKERLGAKLKSAIPLDVYVLCLDRPPSAEPRRSVAEDEILSAPMRAFWAGVKKEGWVSEGPPAGAGGFLSVLATHLTSREPEDFSESSFAIVSREYMVLSLRMGYHFTTIEALCTPDPGKNYIRMQHKGGGASPDRRVRRVTLISDLLSRIGFEHSGAGDFLDSAVSYLDARTSLDVLELLGRITMLTKQLDIALSNDAITRWYTEDFAKTLGL